MQDLGNGGGGVKLIRSTMKERKEERGKEEKERTDGEGSSKQNVWIPSYGGK